MFDLEYYNKITDFAKLVEKIEKMSGSYNNDYVYLQGARGPIRHRLKGEQNSVFFEFEAITLIVGEEYAEWFFNWKYKNFVSK
jgi:hypothetical protein